MGGRKRSSADRLVAVGLGFLVLYGAVVLVDGRSAPERFPFFNWSLFSQVPDPVTSDYSIRFTSVNGEDLDEPVYFEASGDFLSSSGSPTARLTIRNLGKATEAERLLAVARHQDVLEKSHLASLDQAEYQLVKRRFDILERRTCDCFLSETVLGEGSVP